MGASPKCAKLGTRHDCSARGAPSLSVSRSSPPRRTARSESSPDTSMRARTRCPLGNAWSIARERGAAEGTALRVSLHCGWSRRELGLCASDARRDDRAAELAC
ncbi:MAG: hypothetical protein BGO98_10535 [Myxococcales bacterium 68-20]|nr:MAG: hypothetical protein BGO98_10535 [Myxococcales bacterium 68-20]